MNLSEKRRRNYSRQIKEYFISRIMSCRTPVNNGHDLAKLIHDQLIIDLENGSLPKVNQILNEIDNNFVFF